jgi:hypothetical protein
VIRARGKILSEDGRVEFTDFCDVALDGREVKGVLEWFGWITLPPGKASILVDTDYLLILQDGTQRNIILRERYAEPAMFEGIGAPF